ncbi:hypothetical protein BGZ49_003797, partial [Haplosporangium sp. Z 27]
LWYPPWCLRRILIVHTRSSMAILFPTLFWIALQMNRTMMYSWMQPKKTRTMDKILSCQIMSSENFKFTGDLDGLDFSTGF